MGMGIPRLAMMAGISYELAKGLQDFYFQLNPEVRAWQQRIERDIGTKGFISNCYGRRGFFLNKNDPMLLNKALAFIPQSTIGDLVNHAAVEIAEKLPLVEIKMQVHDSLVMQYPVETATYHRKEVVKCMELELPYAGGLIIPSDIQVSRVSYGDVAGL